MDIRKATPIVHRHKKFVTIAEMGVVRGGPELSLALNFLRRALLSLGPGPGAYCVLSYLI